MDDDGRARVCGDRALWNPESNPDQIGVDGKKQKKQE